MGTRYTFLDGIRGWGALTVLFFHVFIDCFPDSKGWISADQLYRIFLFNGRLAVWIFFVVSGFALSVGFFVKGEVQQLLSILCRRYFRLALPIFGVSIFVFAAFVLGLIPPVESRPLVFQQAFLEPVTFVRAIKFSLYDVFFDYDGKTSLVPPLWTMKYELWGSFIVLGLLIFFGKAKRRLLIYLGFFGVALAIQPYYAGFLAGVIMADLYTGGLQHRYEKWINLCFCILMLPLLYGATLLPHSGPLFYLTIAVAMTFFLVFQKHLAAFVSNPWSQFLGKISFSLYLVHDLVIWTLGLWLHGNGTQSLIANILIVLVSIAAAMLFLPIETGSHRLVSRGISKARVIVRSPLASRDD